MAAIWGLVDFKNKYKQFSFKELIENEYKNLKVDKINYIKRENVHTGCALQFITKESENENLPRVQEDIIITSNSTIYNRKELSNELNIDENELDSEFIFKGYKKWGEVFQQNLVGDFVFAIIDKNYIQLTRDHVGKEVVYYYFKEDIFIFSTLISTIVESLKLLGIKSEINEPWIDIFLSIDGMVNEKEVSETQIKDIFILPPATNLTIKDGKMELKKYWFPENIKELKLKNEEEYFNRFRELFKECVECRVRTIGKVGVLISGGLDSTSVAAMAASTLKELYGYNFSPNPKYKMDYPKYVVVNEMEYVDKIVERYTNLKVKSTHLEGFNSIKNAKELIKIIEGPYKIIENLYWMVELIRISKNDGCKVMLSGQYGNCTISFGEFQLVAKSLMKRHPIRFNKELTAYCKKYKWKRYKFYLKYFKEKFTTIEELRRNIISPVGLSHIGVIENKVKLATGVALRDPTRDKRIIEFCLSLPLDIFLKNGVDRRLVREGLKEYIPDEVRMNSFKKGLQSADWAFRIYEDKDNFNLTEKELRKFIIEEIFNYWRAEWKS
ncbi:MAG: asparagine synthase-related protein [Clostridium sp.]